ncbi:MAG: hypothetical protein QJR12_16965 [Mycobacterium sp.]|uniref:hypothetical protein n=1 Tax=Mycobacterium sp. TaxID=1785 RepID=UPI002612FD3F|nr:hypothetical protein [Mycobacterium sp.]MDI3315899.1 hypothetical protein [Mycobacterium sp.]
MTPPAVRALISILVAIAAVVLITIAAGLTPDVPPACHIPGHTYTTVYECEEQ